MIAFCYINGGFVGGNIEGRLLTGQRENETKPKTMDRSKITLNFKVKMGHFSRLNMSIYVVGFLIACLRNIAFFPSLPNTLTANW